MFFLSSSTSSAPRRHYTATVSTRIVSFAPACIIIIYRYLHLHNIIICVYRRRRALLWIYIYTYVLLLRNDNIILCSLYYVPVPILYYIYLMTAAAIRLIKRFTGLHGHVVSVVFITILFFFFTRIKYCTYPPAIVRSTTLTHAHSITSLRPTIKYIRPVQRNSDLLRRTRLRSSIYIYMYII